MDGVFGKDRTRDRFHAAYDEALRHWPVPCTELDVETSWGPTRVRRCGAGTGVPIVLLHGTLSTSVSWYPYIAELAEEHQVFAVDTIDEPGRSTLTRPVRDAGEHAGWLAEVLTGLGHPRVHLAGISRGGWLALNLAAKSGEQVASVTAVEPAGFGRVGRRFYWWAAKNLVRSATPLRRFATLSATEIAVYGSLRSLLFAAGSSRVRLPPPEPLTEDELRALPERTQLIFAEHSALHRSAQVRARLSSVVPEMRVEVVPGASHGLSLERPELVIARILAFARPRHQ
ncbi:alpha/beta fold hydrolase [Amycolatopsis magusensis]|uniref:Pimeloyl-ACP methyl ester carboxylesterase n=1 Tax=Amycolatopsis magusensis TaxID=882444 RepID=A0ABS4PW55_9PSEU|nr:alpha/beta fold hydrolase [Amycolatopsis magusensis]MBP2182816.1 pimeloyl-ACP methyl ester carboxylesterase [Amycolatopsis magusensis]